MTDENKSTTSNDQSNNPDRDAPGCGLVVLVLWAVVWPIYLAVNHPDEPPKTVRDAKGIGLILRLPAVTYYWFNGYDFNASSPKARKRLQVVKESLAIDKGFLIGVISNDSGLEIDRASISFKAYDDSGNLLSGPNLFKLTATVDCLEAGERWKFKIRTVAGADKITNYRIHEIKP